MIRAALLLGAVLASQLVTDTTAGENPIRKIVRLLQKMQTEITEEGERDKDLNEKFVCYCETNDGELSDSTASLRARIPEIEASIEQAVSLKAQLDAELVKHKADRENAKASITSATKQREKEAEEFASASAELSGNIASCKAAVSALTKGLQGGMAGEFLQSQDASALRNLVLTRVSLTRYAREALTEFLSVSSGTHYVPVSNEVIGIISQLQEDMEKELAAITKVENDAITQYEGLVSAKEKEIAAASEAIESKTARAGETAVQIVSLKNDLEDVKDALGADEVFLMELKKNCATKGTEFDERAKIRAQELVAISETIKILNDDDALDLFKKTLPSPTLLQFEDRDHDLRSKALAVLKKVRGEGNPKFNFVELVLKGKKMGFGKVIKMIDDLVALLATEQTDDDTHRDWCNTEFNGAENKEGALKRRVAGLETKVTETEEAIAQIVDELETLRQNIKELDRAVEDATTQRKDEHKEYLRTQSENNAALQLLEVAKNRLNKFYNPTLYKGPERRELSEEEKLYVKAGGADPRDAEEAAEAARRGGVAGTGVELPDHMTFVQLRMRRDAPPPPPETVDAYAKKDASGPTALIDKLGRDLEKDMQENTHDEESSQKDYERFMSDTVAARTADSTSVTEKEAQKAELEGDLMGAKELKKTKGAELMATQEYIHQLHGSCDFLLQNYDLRKEARANEKEALLNAKAVLSGADYAFNQVSASQRVFLSKH